MYAFECPEIKGAKLFLSHTDEIPYECQYQYAQDGQTTQGFFTGFTCWYNEDGSLNSGSDKCSGLEKSWFQDLLYKFLLRVQAFVWLAYWQLYSMWTELTKLF